MESILTSTKKLCGGISEEDTTFDDELIIHINTVLALVQQAINIGPENGFFIEGKTETWSDFVNSDNKYFRMIRTYVPAKVRYIFDPPTGAAMEALKETIKELEWRLNIAAE